MAEDWRTRSAEARTARTGLRRKRSAERPVFGSRRGERSQAQPLIGCDARRK